MKNPKQAEEGATLKQIEPTLKFKVVYETIYKRIDFTIDEWGLLHRLIYLAPSFKPTSQKLASILKISVKRVNQASKGLQEKGFLKIKKFGKNSEWIITQEPTEKLKNLEYETILKALLNYEITLKDLAELHRLKYIDDREYIKIYEDMLKETIRIAKINVYDD